MAKSESISTRQRIRFSHRHETSVDLNKSLRESPSSTGLPWYCVVLDLENNKEKESYHRFLDRENDSKGGKGFIVFK